MSGRRFHVLPAIHGPAGDGLKHHDFALAGCGKRGKHEILANIGNQVEADRGIRTARAQVADVSEGENTLRLGIGRASWVALENITEGTLAAGHNYKIVAA